MIMRRAVFGIVPRNPNCILAENWHGSLEMMGKFMRRFLFLIAFVATPALGFEMPKDEEAAQFVTSNVVGTFYHELGHAIIDVMQLPVLGREEDAADTLSSLLIDEVWVEESASAMVADNANAYILYDAERGQDNQPYWDVHGLDLQRYYNMICLFYGANPTARADLAKEFELPDDRAQGCPEEYEQAQASWGAMLDQIAPEENPAKLVMVDGLGDDPIAKILIEEIATINEMYSLAEPVTVTVAPCGEANAYYSSADRTITICTEYAEDLARLWAESS